jgi:hypothetical protein
MADSRRKSSAFDNRWRQPISLGCWGDRGHHTVGPCSGAAVFGESVHFSVIDEERRDDYKFSMTKIDDLSTAELRRIVAIKEQIEALQGQIDSIAGRGKDKLPVPSTADAPKKRRMSPAGRAKIAAAAKARWAKIRGAIGEAAPKKRRKMSTAARAKIAAAAKARWAKVKAAKHGGGPGH